MINVRQSFPFICLCCAFFRSQGRYTYVLLPFPHINIPVAVHFKQNASKKECMLKLSLCQIQSPSKRTFVSQYSPISAQYCAASLTLLFMHQRSSFSLSSTVGRIFFLIIFPTAPNLNMHSHKQCVKSPSLLVNE